MRISDWSSDVCSSDLTIESVSDGETREIHALYVVGCDGAWSPVREAMGLKFEDLEFDEPWLVVDALVGDDVPLPATTVQYCDPARPATFVRGPGDRKSTRLNSRH